ncbi:MAG: hypothetical protein JXR96_30960 [Deltaproteobacteria bacterium]|nr:hypothetical protein [Deltaproteobacteria bacterium]
MEIWTRKRDQLGWTMWPDVLRGLASLRDAPDAKVLLYVETPDEEHDRLVAALKLIRGLEQGHRDIVLASPHPSSDWVDSLRSFGVDHLWTVGHRGADGPAGLDRIAQIQGGVCPHLHSRTARGVSLSVCGCHHDRMVLARHHLDRWCLRDGRGCPHLSRGCDDA